ncbi:hypothetical protein SNK03_009304 [Fusarium graminearum]
MCQWAPFGKTPVGDVDLEVPVHQQCEDHWLQYEGIEWECEDGNFGSLELQKADSQPIPSKPHVHLPTQEFTTDISYEGLDRDREAISENATRNIFGWLLVDGYVQGEQDIWKDEWLDMSDSDDDDVDEEETTSYASAQLSPRVESWVFDISH